MLAELPRPAKPLECDKRLPAEQGDHLRSFPSCIRLRLPPPQVVTGGNQHREWQSIILVLASISLTMAILHRRPSAAIAPWQDVALHPATATVPASSLSPGWRCRRSCYGFGDRRSDQAADSRSTRRRGAARRKAFKNLSVSDLVARCRASGWLTKCRPGCLSQWCERSRRADLW